MVQNPAEVAAFVYECKKACLAMSSLSGQNGRYHNELSLMLLVHDTSGCSSQGLSWSPSNRYLNRSKLASTRSCNNQRMGQVTAGAGVLPEGRGASPQLPPQAPAHEARAHASVPEPDVDTIEGQRDGSVRVLDSRAAQPDISENPDVPQC